MKKSKAEYKRSLPLSYKVYIIILISIAFCAVFIGMYYYFESKGLLRENIGKGLEQIAKTAALVVHPESLNNISSTEGFFYAQLRSYLLGVKERNDIKSPIYILRKKDSSKAQLVLSSEHGFIPGAEYRINPTMKKTFDTGQSSYSPIYHDKSGTWISAYAPITDKNGSTVAVIEINNEVGHYIAKLRVAFAKIIIVCIVGFGFGIILGINLLNPILSAINALHSAAVEMEKGNYNYKIEVHSSDEIGHLASAFDKMRLSIKKYTEQLKEAWIKERNAHLESIKTLSEVIAIREPLAVGHVERVCKYAALIAREMGFSEDDIKNLEYGCALHDVGKVGINVDIINKPSKLTPSEYEKVKQHPNLGAKIISGIKFLTKAREVILYHQERYDGKGYPNGLKGEEIPLAARIVTLADAYDAMASKRPYKEGMDSDYVISVITKEAGKQFDPKVVEAFLRLREKIERIS